jgi:hypothetical protein
MDTIYRREEEPKELRTGTGGLCPEAQADGVPCPTLDRDCEECENAPPENSKERAQTIEKH